MPLSPAELREYQQRYLDMPTYRYGLPARVLFWTAGKVFPQGRSFEFFALVLQVFQLLPGFPLLFGHPPDLALQALEGL